MKALDNRFYVKFLQLEIGLLNTVYFIIARAAADGPGPLKPVKLNLCEGEYRRVTPMDSLKFVDLLFPARIFVPNIF